MSVPKKIRERGKILDEIMRYHRENLPKIMRDVPFESVRAFAAVVPSPLDFYEAITKPGVSLIAECKKASPSKGLIAPKYDPVKTAALYEKAGASAISVLTDGRHFQGSLADLRDVRETVAVPVLRKDFIFHPYQIYEARAAGADCILLIAAVLGDGDLHALLDLTHKLRMNALVEVHTDEEIHRVLNLPTRPKIIGVNNRNLQTFEVDFANTARLRQLIPAEIAVVGESGLKTEEDVRAMKKIGVEAILVGETLMRARDPLGLAQRFIQAGKN
ncbi:MAG: indole-3-glycerol phosphate synthase TrpC [Ardenticatenaceae bacterium]|nr:indole-3-glycerol phosphate synthase TrpC [Ardenticatenaceae bacterium]